MQVETIEKIKKLMMTDIVNSNLKPEDKLELITNICNYLDAVSYKHNIKVLQKGINDSNNKRRNK